MLTKRLKSTIARFCIDLLTDQELEKFCDYMEAANESHMVEISKEIARWRDVNDQVILALIHTAPSAAWKEELESKLDRLDAVRKKGIVKFIHSIIKK